MILETERLYLREMEQTDFEALCRILQDEDTMYAYEGAFNNDEVHEWLDRQIARYQKWGFESAKACKKYAFETLDATEVCSIIRDTNVASQNVAIRNGMVIKDTWMKHYRGIDMPHYRYVVYR